jgi:hypothetical protein
MKSRSIDLLLILVSATFLTNCSSDNRSTKKLEGDLYYSLFRIGNFYNQPDSIIQKAKLYLDTVNRKLLDSSDLLDLTRYELLKKENLLYRPFIDLKLDNDSIIKIYLSSADYEKIKIFKRQDLLNAKKKVRLILDVHDLGLGMALATKIISANKIDAQTSRNNKKFLIEDYH